MHPCATGPLSSRSASSSYNFCKWCCVEGCFYRRSIVTSHEWQCLRSMESCIQLQNLLERYHLLFVTSVTFMCSIHACAGPQGACAGAGGAIQLRDAGPAAAGLHQGGRPTPQGQLRSAPCVPHATLSVSNSLTCPELALKIVAACLLLRIDAGSFDTMASNKGIWNLNVQETFCNSYISKISSSSFLGR